MLLSEASIIIQTDLNPLDFSGCSRSW